MYCSRSVCNTYIGTPRINVPYTWVDINFVSCKQMLMGIAVRARGSGYTKQKILGLASESECVQ